MILGMFSGLGVSAVAADVCGYDAAMSMEDLFESGENAVKGKCYSISDDDELLQFADYVNEGRLTEGVTFYLKHDIKLPDKEWAPIGSTEHMFAGTLDGCGFTITNMNTLNTAYYNEAGFFAYLTGTVINLGIAGRAEGAVHAGGIAAVSFGAKVTNCWSAVRLKAADAGGIIGNATDTIITNCCNYNSVSGTLNVGAIAGKLSGQAKTEYCYYLYTSAISAVGTYESGCTVGANRFATSPTMCVVEKEISVGGTKSENLTDLLNIWVDTQTGDVFYRSWIFDLNDSNIEKTGGRFPCLRFPNYVSPETPIYEATSSMTTLYEIDADAEKGAFYSISTAAELGYLAEFVNRGRNTKDATFFLTADLSIITQEAHYKDFYTGESWVPIGETAATPFRGVFDGQGFVISEVMFSNKAKYPGLFGYIDDNDAVVKNVGVTGNIMDGETSGGIVCELINGTIKNSWYSGNVWGDDIAGGIAGSVQDGRIENCAYFGSVTGRELIGGIAGSVGKTGELRYCYYSDDNSAAAGENLGQNYMCVNFRMLEGYYTLTRSVKINQESTVRLLNALNDWVDSSKKEDSFRYWKSDNSMESIARIRGKHPTHIFFGDASTLSREEETEADRTPKENPYNIIYNATSTMTELYESKQNVVNGGNYSISTGDEMSLLSLYVEEGYDTKGANFFLTEDIYLTTQGIDHGGAGFTPIGTGISIDFEITGTKRFLGDFDGCGYTVYGLYIVSDFLDFAGLFGRCKGSTIKNLGVCGDILGDDEVGGIVGRLEDGKIINCWSAVNIQCSTELGGIAGHIIDSSIENCACYGMLVTTLDEGEDSGGIVGSTLGNCTIDNSYYLYVGADAPYNKVSDKTVINDLLYFHYDILGDQSCTLQQAITLDDVTSDDLLTLLNAWVYMQGNDQYCTWHAAASIQEVPGANGYFPVLTKPGFDNTAGINDYYGDYTETATMSALYSTRSDGIKGGFYSIATTDDLRAFREYVNAGYDTRDITFFMKRDVNMGSVWSPETGQEWIPVGTTRDPFQGVFDGQGYTLKYLYIKSAEDNQGFFGTVTGVNSVIKNLGISGNVISSGNDCAAIVADLNFGSIENCWSSCSVEGLSTVGGIAGGCNMGKITNCANYGAIISTGAYGAIAGFPVGTQISCCYYLYGAALQAYPPGSTPIATGVTYFNGTGAACILHDKVTINGTVTRNAASALKLYVDAHPEINYCYWDIADNLEYYEMMVFGFPVLISASNTKGEKDYKTIQAEFKGEQFYSVMKACERANETEGGGTVKLLINAVLQRSESVTLDDDVILDTCGYSLIIKTSANARYMRQLIGTYTVKEGGGVYLWDDTQAKYMPFMFSRKTADPSCNSAFFSNQSITFVSSPIETGDKTSYDIELQVGEFKVNSSADSGNPHRIPPRSRLTIGDGATLNVITNARIRTTGGAQVFNNGTIKIGNATLDCNGGILMKGIMEDSAGKVTLPYVYMDGYTLRGWSDGVSIYLAGTSIDINKAVTLQAQWKIGVSGDPYPGDDAFHDPTEKVYDIPIDIIQSYGGELLMAYGDKEGSTESTYVAKGDNITLSVKANSGYYLKNIILDGKSVSLDNEGKYVLASVNEAHRAVALFGKTSNLDYYSYIDEYKFRPRFNDVGSSDWYYRAVCELVAAGYFIGTSETGFSPENIMSREMMVTVLWRLAGSPLIPGVGCRFTDVPTDSYAYEAIRWANEYGMIQGMTEIKFGYLEPMTREQFVTVLFRFARDYCGLDVSKYDNTNILQYKDEDKISFGMHQAFQWAVGARMVQGPGDMTLDPHGTTTRAQAVSILFRFCNTFIFRAPIIDL